MIRRFVLATEATEPTHLASEPIYSPDHSTSAHINLLDCSAGSFLLRVCGFLFLYICICVFLCYLCGELSVWPGPLCPYCKISSEETDWRFLDPGRAAHIHHSSSLVSWWFRTYRSGPASCCTLTTAIPSPSHLRVLISLHRQPGAQPIPLYLCLYVCV